MGNQETKLKIEDRINCILVLGEIRPACYIQDNGNDHVDFKKRIHNLKESFSELFFHNLEPHILITPLPVPIPDNDDDLGKILGYKSKIPFSQLDRDQDFISHNIVIEFNDNKIPPIHIITVLDQTPALSSYYNGLACKIENFLKKNNFYPPIKKVFYNLSVHLSLKAIIQKLSFAERPISDEEKYEIWNELWNYTMGESVKIEEKIDLENPIYREAVLSLLLSSKENPFYSNDEREIKIYQDEKADEVHRLVMKLNL